MKKIDLAQTVAILANLGVVAGIVFLALEIRQNNELLQSEASIDMRRGALRAQAQDNELLSTILKAEAGEKLSSLESLRLDLEYYSIFVIWEWEYEQYQAGALDLLDQPPELRWRPCRKPLPESPLIEPDFSMSGQKVAQALERYLHGKPAPLSLTVDHGTEFTSKALEEWAWQHNVKLDFIHPGKPKPDIRVV